MWMSKTITSTFWPIRFKVSTVLWNAFIKARKLSISVKERIKKLTWWCTSIVKTLGYHYKWQVQSSTSSRDFKPHSQWYTTAWNPPSILDYLFVYKGCALAEDTLITAANRSSAVAGIFRQAVLISWMVEWRSLRSVVMVLWFTGCTEKKKLAKHDLCYLLSFFKHV